MKCKIFENETNDANDLHFTTHIRMFDVIYVNEREKSQQKCNQNSSERSISDRKNHNENIQNDFDKDV